MLIWNIETLQQREIAENEGYPAGWTTVEPPTVEPGFRAMFGVDTWVVTAIPIYFLPPTPQPGEPVETGLGIDPNIEPE